MTYILGAIDYVEIRPIFFDATETTILTDFLEIRGDRNYKPYQSLKYQLDQ